MSNRIVPLPGREFMIRGGIGCQHLRVCGRIAIELGKYAKLVGGTFLVLLHPRFKLPPHKSATIESKKGPGTKPSARRSLPVTVINHVLDFWLFPAGILQWLP